MVASLCPWRIVKNFLEKPTWLKTATAPPLQAPLSAVPINNRAAAGTAPPFSLPLIRKAKGIRLLGWAWGDRLVLYDLILSAHPHRLGHHPSCFNSNPDPKCWERGQKCILQWMTGRMQSFLATSRSTPSHSRKGGTLWWRVSGPAPSRGQIW